MHSNHPTNLPPAGRTQTVAVAIYDAVEAGRGEIARVLVMTISLLTILILTLANRLGSTWATPRPGVR